MFFFAEFKKDGLLFLHIRMAWETTTSSQLHVNHLQDSNSHRRTGLEILGELADTNLPDSRRRCENP